MFARPLDTADMQQSDSVGLTFPANLLAFIHCEFGLFYERTNFTLLQLEFKDPLLSSR